eukprot:1133430-Prymnesium_polylepis.2
MRNVKRALPKLARDNKQSVEKAMKTGTLARISQKLRAVLSEVCRKGALQHDGAMQIDLLDAMLEPELVPILVEFGFVSEHARILSRLVAQAYTKQRRKMLLSIVKHQVKQRATGEGIGNHVTNSAEKEKLLSRGQQGKIITKRNQTLNRYLAEAERAEPLLPLFRDERRRVLGAWARHHLASSLKQHGLDWQVELPLIEAYGGANGLNEFTKAPDQFARRLRDEPEVLLVKMLNDHVADETKKGMLADGLLSFPTLKEGRKPCAHFPSTLFTPANLARKVGIASLRKELTSRGALPH